MSIRHGLLALLERGPRYGYQLRTEFESRTGSTWPLNVGQVYTTLARLERDGLVVPAGEDEAGHALYAITDGGRSELRHWYASPVDRASPPRNELAIKLAMAVGAPDVDVRAVIQAQRVHTIKAMQDYTRLKAQALDAVTRGESAPDRDDVAWQLVLDQMIFQAEAEARWLDHCETRLARIAASSPGWGAAPPQGGSAGSPAEAQAGSQEEAQAAPAGRDGRAAGASGRTGKRR
ncbi:PadR family transcriptional regulator [Actinacidiphila rubida]|uniref:DNA-binding transcriptional regulator, PadR family n=1 Tax=Actinacidiphila rubida TaxID=310780 RepID=A0A1H8GM52_9ACTN|nr:PadR family transcriptional regulator [Actinacidiphila rubida]SEN45092.1 DNA-binding transcriptional regulator, PadR family [Actinacidiphila rubida]